MTDITSMAYITNMTQIIIKINIDITRISNQRRNRLLTTFTFLQTYNFRL